MPPISSANLKYYLSGGSGNTNPNASLGGARSTTPVGSAIDNVFDDVTSAESTAGAIEYRCVYFRNEDVNANGLILPTAFISSNTPSADTTIAIGIDPVGKNGTATTIANEVTAPTGVTFSSPSTYGTGLALPGAPYGQNDFIAIWIRRTVNAGAASALTDPATLRVEGDTV
jgi:hypothetical protein